MFRSGRSIISARDAIPQITAADSLRLSREVIEPGRGSFVIGFVVPLLVGIDGTCFDSLLALASVVVVKKQNFCFLLIFAG